VRCTLIYNPSSGIARARREEQLRRVAEVLSASGNKVELIFTTGPGSATLQAREAAGNGAEVVFACGGDGTIHEVLQGLIPKTGEPVCALGIVPMGSANALARHLRLSLDPLKAAIQQLNGVMQTIPVGVLNRGDSALYFLVMVGAGPDGALAHSVLQSTKSSLGRFAYYTRAARLFLFSRFRPFKVEYLPTGSSCVCAQLAVSVMAVRVGSLGGLFARLTDREASIHQPALQLAIVRPPAVVSLPLWFILGWLGLHRLNPFLLRASATGFSCHPSSESSPLVQADGEWIGHAPIEVSLLSAGLRIVIPKE